MNFKISEENVIYLQQGELCSSSSGVVVSTVLGSCLAITMYNKNTGFGIISHCMLPKCKHGIAGCNDCTAIYRYVDCTILKMIEKFNAMKIKRDDIEVKMFGGADVLKPVDNIKNAGSVGSQNVLTALTNIEKYNLKLVSSDVGGEKGRRIFFKTNTGEVFVKKVIEQCRR